METILLIDVDPSRADLICELLIENEVPAKRCQNLLEIREMIDSDKRPAVIVVHCALVNRSFTDLARLRHHPKVELLFYCTDPDERSGSIMKLPEELTKIILRITESKRALLKAS